MARPLSVSRNNLISSVFEILWCSTATSPMSAPTSAHGVCGFAMSKLWAARLILKNRVDPSASRACAGPLATRKWPQNTQLVRREICRAAVLTSAESSACPTLLTTAISTQCCRGYFTRPASCICVLNVIRGSSMILRRAGSCV